MYLAACRPVAICALLGLCVACNNGNEDLKSHDTQTPIETSADSWSDSETVWLPPRPATCNPCSVQGTVDPQGLDLGRTRGGAGYIVRAGSQTTTSVDDGSWRLEVPPTTERFDVTGDSILKGVTYILPKWLDDFGEEFLLNTVLASAIGTLFDLGFNQAHDPDRGLVIVNAVLPDDQDALGIAFTLDRDHGGSFSIQDPGTPLPGRRTSFHGAMMFPNTAPGVVNIRSVQPNYLTCEGPTRIEVEANSITTALWRCTLLN